MGKYKFNDKWLEDINLGGNKILFRLGTIGVKVTESNMKSKKQQQQPLRSNACIVCTRKSSSDSLSTASIFLSPPETQRAEVLLYIVSRHHSSESHGIHWDSFLLQEISLKSLQRSLKVLNCCPRCMLRR